METRKKHTIALQDRKWYMVIYENDWKPSQLRPQQMILAIWNDLCCDSPRVYTPLGLSATFKGGSRHKAHKAHHYDEWVLFFIRHFSNCSILHRNALATSCVSRSALGIDQVNIFPWKNYIFWRFWIQHGRVLSTQHECKKKKINLLHFFSDYIDTAFVSTRPLFDVVTTLFGRQQRCYNVETKSFAYWVM